MFFTLFQTLTSKKLTQHEETPLADPTLKLTIPMKHHHCQNILQYRLQFVFQLSNAIFMDVGRYTSVHSPVRFPNVHK